MNIDQVLDELRAMGDPSNLAGQARFGIEVSSSLGVSMSRLRPFARRLGKDHLLALALWESGIREARILATLVDDPALVTGEQMEAWAADFTSWEVVDAACCNLFDRTGLRYTKAREWAGREEEFIKRAGFSLMAGIAIHDKRASDEDLMELLAAIEREACDRRNFVRKALNWALRQIGKRNLKLNRAAVDAARRISQLECPGAAWVAGDALRELQGEQVQRRLRVRAKA